MNPKKTAAVLAILVFVLLFFTLASCRSAAKKASL